MNLEYVTVGACIALVAATLFGSNIGIGTALSGAVANISTVTSCALTPELNPQLCKRTEK